MVERLHRLHHPLKGGLVLQIREGEQVVLLTFLKFAAPFVCHQDGLRKQQVQELRG